MQKTLKVVAIAFAFVAAVSTANAAFNTDLSVGSTGPEVASLQTWLISKNFAIPAISSGVAQPGYFGSQTVTAVKAYQAANGVPSTGYFGPLTRAAVNKVGGAAPVAMGCPIGYTCTANPGTTPATSVAPGTLKGGAGSITVDALSTYSSEDVVEGDKDAKVLAFEVQADDESDIEVTSIKVELAQTVTSNSEDVSDYIDSVSVWFDGKKVGEADADSFSENSDIYTKSISLKGAVVRSDETKKFIIAVTAQNNLDSGDIDNDAFTVDVLNVRFTDAEGVVTTEDTDGEVLDRTFDFDDLATSGDLEAKISENSANPDARTVEVDTVSDTNDVLLLVVDFKATGADMTIDDLNFDITPTGANANEIVKEYKLLMNGEEIDSISATSIASTVTGNITFTDLEDEIMVDEDGKVTFKLVADINDIEGNFTNGDSILASLTSTNFAEASTTIDDSQGDTVVNADRSGSVTGEAQTFYSDGISVVLDSTTATPYTVDSTDNDRVELVIKFKVTAFGQDAYIPSFMTPTTAATNATVGQLSASTTPTTASGVAFHVQSSDTGLAISQLGGSTITSTAEEKTNSFKIVEGQTETFTLTVKVTNAATSVLDSASIRAFLTGVNFGDTDVATGDFVFTSDLADTFKTPYATIAD